MPTPRRRASTPDTSGCGVPGLAVAHHAALVEGHQAGERAHQGRLAGAVGPDHRQHVAAFRAHPYVERVRGSSYDHVRVEEGGAHTRTVPCAATSNHRSRSSASTATETSIRITLITSAASGSDCSAT